jgi:hypothetical protein
VRALLVGRTGKRPIARLVAALASLTERMVLDETKNRKKARPRLKLFHWAAGVAVWAQRAVGICPVGLANFPGSSLDLAADSLLTFVLGGQWLADSRYRPFSCWPEFPVLARSSLPALDIPVAGIQVVDIPADRIRKALRDVRRRIAGETRPG